MVKERLDLLLVKKHYAISRERAKSIIMAGLVLVNEKKIDKAGTVVPIDAQIRLLGDNNPYVSRGGLKLAKAIKEFNLSLSGLTMIDIGASTGGFTDCALQNGVAKVFSIDVGYGQLAWKLRTDKRVINMERTNIRQVTADLLGEKVDFISIDVAFISLQKVLPVAKELLKNNGCIVALIKPQFEAGRDKVGKKGVVRDPLVHNIVIKETLDFAYNLNLYATDLTFSPIKGPEGNIEYLAKLVLHNSVLENWSENDVEKLVKDAHDALDK